VDEISLTGEMSDKEDDDKFNERPPSLAYRPIVAKNTGHFFPVTPTYDDWSLVQIYEQAFLQEFPSLEALYKTPEAVAISVNKTVYCMFGASATMITPTDRGMTVPLSPHFSVAAAHSVYQTNYDIPRDTRVFLDNRCVIRSCTVRKKTSIEAWAVTGIFSSKEPDVNPITTQPVHIPNDVGFLQIAHEKKDENLIYEADFPSYFIPSTFVNTGAHAWLVARHGKATKEELNEAKISEDDAFELFRGYDVKCVSSGTVTAHNPSLVCASVSCTHGASGGPLLVNTFALDSLIGFCIGAPSVSHGNISYNQFLSVDHPMFVVNYANIVVPDLPSSAYPQIIPYLAKHVDLLRQHNCTLALQIATTK